MWHKTTQAHEVKRCATRWLQLDIDDDSSSKCFCMPLQGFKDGAECFFYSGSCRIETCFLANNYLHQKNQRFSKDIPQSARYHFKQSNVGQSVFFFQFQVWT